MPPWSVPRGGSRRDHCKVTSQDSGWPDEPGGLTSGDGSEVKTEIVGVNVKTLSHCLESHAGSPLDYALAYAARGLAVLPCFWPRETKRGLNCACGAQCSSPGKHPIGELVPRGSKNASVDEATIRGWWTRYPRANIAIVTNGLVVLDVDRPKGDASFAALVDRVGQAVFESALHQRSGGGGDHFIWKCGSEPIKSVANWIAPGLDCKGEGGYLLVEPSLHASGGSYVFEAGRELSRPLNALPYALSAIFPKQLSQGKASDLANPPVEKKENLQAIADAYRAIGGELGDDHLVGSSLRVRCVSPAHNDEHPSLILDCQKNIWKCFVCDVGGGVLDLVVFAGLAVDRDDARKLLTSRGVHIPLPLSAAAVAPKVTWDEVHPWPTLREEALFGLLGDIVRILAPHTEADSAALLATALTMFGCAVARADGSAPYLSIGAVRHPPILYSLIIGATAKARKGQSYAEIYQIFAQADKEFIEGVAISGLSSGEGLIHHVRDRGEGDQPTEKRVLVHEAEFARVLAATSRKESTLSPILRDAWDRRPLHVLTRIKPLEAKNAYVCIIAHVTAEELNAKLGDLDIENGLLNRFIAIAVRRSKKLSTGGTLKLEDVVHLGQRLRTVIDRARRYTEVALSEPAAEYWDELYKTRFPDEVGLVGSALGRGEAYTLRLSTAFALADEEAYCLDGQRFLLEKKHIQAGFAMWEYVEASTRHVFGSRLVDRDADLLIGALRAKYPDGLDLSAQQAIFSNHRSVSRLDGIRETLLRSSLVRHETVQTGGRPREVWYAVRRGESERSDKSESIK
jgi:hypothetical protein